MKTEKIQKEMKRKSMQCMLCQADFKLWVNALDLSEEKKQKILSQYFLNYCPACARETEERNKSKFEKYGTL